MSTIAGENYTSFRGVNVYDGVIRLADCWEDTYFTRTNAGNYGVSLAVPKKTLTASRTIYMTDGAGSMMVTGYDVIYGTSSFYGCGALAASTVAQASITLTGVLSSCVILVSAESSAAAAFVPIGAKYATTDKIWVFYKTQAATSISAEVPINYIVYYPQTT